MSTFFVRTKDKSNVDLTNIAKYSFYSVKEEKDGTLIWTPAEDDETLEKRLLENKHLIEGIKRAKEGSDPVRNRIRTRD